MKKIKNYLLGVLTLTMLSVTAVSCSDDDETTVAAPTGTVSVTSTTDLVVEFKVTTTGEVTSYEWDFADAPGTTTGGTTAMPTHTFSAAGTYQVKVKLTGPGGTVTTTALPVTVTAPAAPELTLVNPSFEMPGTVKTWDWSLISGWNISDAATYTDTGVEETRASEGTWSAYVQGGAGVYNTVETGYVITEGEVFTLVVDFNTYDAGAAIKAVVYYLDGASRTEINSEVYTFADGDQNVVKPITVEATAGAAAAGKKVGVEIISTAGGYFTFDNVRLTSNL